jgi:hypothetical protein
VGHNFNSVAGDIFNVVAGQMWGYLQLSGWTNVGHIFNSGGNNVGDNFNSLTGQMWEIFSPLWLDKCGG